MQLKGKNGQIKEVIKGIQIITQREVGLVVTLNHLPKL